MTIKPGIYQHYKGQLYQVLGTCRHTETLEILVVYQSLYGGYNLWVRPFDMFTGTITHEGQVVPRFAFKHDSLQAAIL